MNIVINAVTVSIAILIILNVSYTITKSSLLPGLAAVALSGKPHALDNVSVASAAPTALPLTSKAAPYNLAVPTPMPTGKRSRVENRSAESLEKILTKLAPRERERERESRSNERKSTW